MVTSNLLRTPHCNIKALVITALRQMKPQKRSAWLDTTDCTLNGVTPSIYLGEKQLNITSSFSPLANFVDGKATAAFMTIGKTNSFLNSNVLHVPGGSGTRGYRQTQRTTDFSKPPALPPGAG